MDLKELTVPLKLEDIDFRVQSINKGGYARILAYKDARVDMKRLDEVCGPGYWERKHESVNGVMYCSVGIWNESIKQFVYKQDAGTESQTEAEKGAASDSFKRACFNWGIGRELYDYPSIDVKLEADEFIIDAQGRAKATYKLQISKWKWHIETNDKGEVVILGARDLNGKLRFIYKQEKEEVDELGK